jgi:peroxiredoxin Q/BCP
LQRDLKSIEDAGLHVVGISYDSVAILKTFSDKSKITFPMLSDPGSKTIEDYHIRNSTAKGKAVGVPHPGTYIVDSKGVIRAKLFLDGYRERHSTEALIQAAKGVE